MMLETIGLKVAERVIVKHWKKIAIGALIVGLIFAVQSCKKYQDELLTATDNYEAEIADAQAQTKKQVLTTKQLKKYYETELATLRDSLSIKPKTVTRIQKIITVEHDTIISVIKESPDFNFNDLNVADFKRGCTSGSFVWVDGDSLGTFTITNNNSFLIVDHWERKRLFDWGWTPKWGRKFGKVSVINKCANDTILENKVIEVR